MKLRCTGVVLFVLVGCIAASAGEDFLFIHHSTGGLWLSRGLETALLDKSYIDARNDITYGIAAAPDTDRPDSLGPVAGDLTDMKHWILWFNDYSEALSRHGCGAGRNRIIMFKSCFPNSHLSEDGVAPGDPFSGIRSLANYYAVYAHAAGIDAAYERDTFRYWPLEIVFTQHPHTLFIPVTAPPLQFAPSDGTNDEAAHRARTFNTWLKTTWLDAYHDRTGYRNVAVFDWFDVLAYPDDHISHPNRLREEFGGASGDAHPNNTAMEVSTAIFATDQGSFLDAAWTAFLRHEPEGEAANEGEGMPVAPHAADQNGDLSIALPELLRVIQFFNSGHLHCDDQTEDGYAPGDGTTDCAPHDSDFAPQDWALSLTEMLRAIQFYNLGVCVPCPNNDTEDRFCTD